MANKASGGLLENVKTIVYAGLIAIGIRTVAFEPFNIPSGSMIPTLLVGDYLFVSKYSYGYSRYSMPFSPNLFSGRILGHAPERGDYIKRIIGLPGDRIQVRGGQLFINGTMVPRTPLGNLTASDERGPVSGALFSELLPNGRTHELLKGSDRGPQNDTVEYRVPAGSLFVMGDNRDNSADSRFTADEKGVSFLPIENLVGRAEFIFFSIESRAPWWQFWEWPFEIRWTRLLHGIS